MYNGNASDWALILIGRYSLLFIKKLFNLKIWKQVQSLYSVNNF